MKSVTIFVITALMRLVSLDANPLPGQQCRYAREMTEVELKEKLFRESRKGYLPVIEFDDLRLQILNSTVGTCSLPLGQRQESHDLAAQATCRSYTETGYSSSRNTQAPVTYPTMQTVRKQCPNDKKCKVRIGRLLLEGTCRPLPAYEVILVRQDTCSDESGNGLVRDYEAFRMKTMAGCVCGLGLAPPPPSLRAATPAGITLSP